MIARTAVESSNIASIGYDPESKTLTVEFFSGGLFHYAGVPPELFDTIMAAESKGKVFHRAVRGSYIGVRHCRDCGVQLLQQVDVGGGPRCARCSETFRGGGGGDDQSGNREGDSRV